ncbi:MAG: DNA-processing protein DprA [Aquificaceae bacterium]|nr:DNA-processing protein DprA [Aquificaceae bacterium]
MERLHNWLILKAIKGLGDVSIKKLWLKLGSADRILSASYDECREIVGENKAKAILKKDLSFEPERVIKTLEEENIDWLTLEDQSYPPLLKEIEDPPPVLFFKGDIKPIPMVGVVGTRKPDIQSLSFIRSLVRTLVKEGYGVCSGGAVGCDFQSHRECVGAGGYTLCVLGMGLLKLPSHLKQLQDKNMVFLSEFLPEALPDEYTFPRRNRLISGLSRSLVVVEAGEESGALITANYAVKQRRPIWVYIGNGSSHRWLGCVKLVNEGKAKILHSPNALFEGLTTSKPSEDPILELLSTPKTFDQLLEALKIDPSELTLKLSQLEIEGKLVRQGYHYLAL